MQIFTLQDGWYADENFQDKLESSFLWEIRLQSLVKSSQCIYAIMLNIKNGFLQFETVTYEIQGNSRFLGRNRVIKYIYSFI